MVPIHLFRVVQPQRTSSNVCLCFPRHIHSSWSTVTALLCIPVPRLVSCTFSTIPICPFLIQRIFSFTCLHPFFTCIQQITCSYMLLCGLYQQLYLQLYLKYTSKRGLELMRLLTVELCSIKK